MDNSQNNSQFFILDPDSRWMLEIFLGVCVILVLHWAISYFVRRARNKASIAGIGWLQKIDSIVLLPIKVLFVVIAGYYTINILAQRFELPQLAQGSKPFISSAVIACLAWIAMRWKNEFIHSLQYHPKMISSGLTQNLTKILSMVIFLIAMLLILQAFELDIWPLLAFGGIGAAAVGFAAKDVISNFCGGLMLSITRPFVMGDQIVLPAYDLDGPVEEIGWYLTVIRDKEKRPVYLPNAIFSNAVVINNSRMSHRRILEKINVRYSDFDKIRTVIDKIKVFLKGHSSIDPNIEPLVFFQAINDSSLEIHIDIYVLTTQWAEYLAVKEGMLFAIYNILESEGVKLPLPAFRVETVEKT